MPERGALAGAVLTAEARRAIGALAAGLQAQCRATNTRRMLVLAGSPAWTLAAAEAALTGIGGESTLWLSDRVRDAHRVSVDRGAELLGGETDCLVYDAFSGLDPDSLGAAVGAVRGGGLLLLLTPPHAAWPELTDAQAYRIAVHPLAPSAVTGRYLRRLARVLARAPGVSILAEGGPAPRPPPQPPLAARVGGETRPGSGPGPRTTDQARALDGILALARGRPRRPLVITSDRGRGKTSVLGLAAGALIRQAPLHILVTAPRRAAVDPLFALASAGLPGARVRRNRIDHGGGRIELIAPDALCHRGAEADLLLIDEAAGIPAPVLGQLVQRYPRVVFATTVHGYEGSGRGFEVRFRETLDRLTPGWQALRLNEPVRWAEDDPLEAGLTEALLLDAAPAADALVAPAGVGTTRFERLDREALADNEEDLRALFGLLVLAHYQTRPMDLRHLLDGPNLCVYALRSGDALVATALVAREGRLDAELSRAIFEGRRRPRGHLLAQTLSAHAGLEQAPRLGYARLVRIAVHPAARRRGLARQLLEGIIEDAQRQRLDLIGASFGAAEDLLQFWTRCGFVPVHLGTSRNAASGRHAAVALRPLTADGTELLHQARARLVERLPILLAGPLRALEPEVAAAVLAGSATPVGLSAEERRELDAFAEALRPFEAVVPLLNRLVSARLGEALAREVLTEVERDLLITHVLQQQDWVLGAQRTGTSGRAEILARLRQAAGRLLAGLGGSGMGPEEPPARGTAQTGA